MNQAKTTEGSSNGAKQLLWHAECRCSMLSMIQVILKVRKQLNTLQKYEGEWEQSSKSGMTGFWNKEIDV